MRSQNRLTGISVLLFCWILGSIVLRGSFWASRTVQMLQSFSASGAVPDSSIVDILRGTYSLRMNCGCHDESLSGSVDILLARYILPQLEDVSPQEKGMSAYAIITAHAHYQYAVGNSYTEALS